MAVPAPKSVRTLAKAINVSTGVVQEMVSNGEIAKGPDGTFDVSAALKVKEERARRQRGGVVYDPELQNIKLQREKTRLGRDTVELRRELGEVIERSEVVRNWSKCLLQMKGALSGLGRELAPLVIGRSPHEVQAIIDARVFEIMRTLYNFSFIKESEKHG